MRMPNVNLSKASNISADASISRKIIVEHVPNTMIYDGLIIRNASFGFGVIVGDAPAEDNPRVESELKSQGNEILKEKALDYCLYLSESEDSCATYGIEDLFSIKTVQPTSTDNVIESNQNLDRNSDDNGNMSIEKPQLLATNRSFDILIPPYSSELHERAKHQTEAYIKVVQALKIIKDSVESIYLPKHNGLLKERYVRLLLCAEWYESRKHLARPGRPVPRFLLPHQCIFSGSTLPVEPKISKLGESFVPSVLTPPTGC